jgi:serine protease Do
MRIVLLALFLLAAAPAPGQGPDFTAVVKDAGAAVVNLTGGLQPVLPDVPLADEDVEDPQLLRDFLRRYFGPSPEVRSLGSGFVIDAAGYVITNAQLVGDGRDIVVRLADRREFEATVVGVDPLSDIALLRIEASGLQAVKVGDPAKLRPGEWVAAIGSPYGLERSITAGIVSAVGRTLPEESFVPFIQTDVAVNPGNSGGPLFNLRGEVVGVNSIIYSDTGGYQGLSFAIPIDVAMDVVAQLRAHGKVTRGRIGVRLQAVTGELAKAFKLQRASGALVVDVFSGSAAERAAILPGDVVVRFGEKPVETDADLVRLTAAAKPGSMVDVKLVRFGVPVTARVRVDEARSSAAAVTTQAQPERELLGLQLAPLTARQRERMRIEAGVVVERAGEGDSRAGLLRGDIILSVNGKAVSSPEMFRALIYAAGKGATVALLLQRDGIRQFVPLRVPR